MPVLELIRGNRFAAEHASKRQSGFRCHSNTMAAPRRNIAKQSWTPAETLAPPVGYEDLQVVPDKIIRPCKGLGRFRALGPRQIENPPRAQFALFDLRQGHQPAMGRYRHPALHDRRVAPAQQYGLAPGWPARRGGL